MADVARLVALPMIRCYQQLRNSEIGICGEQAYFERLSNAGFQNGFYCAAHTRAGDRPIAPEVLLRRVSIVLEVSFAGTSPIPSMAHAEALYRLERCVETAGGLLNLTNVTSVMGRYTPPPAPAKGRGRRPKAQSPPLND